MPFWIGTYIENQWKLINENAPFHIILFSNSTNEVAHLHPIIFCYPLFTRFFNCNTLEVNIRYFSLIASQFIGSFSLFVNYFIRSVNAQWIIVKGCLRILITNFEKLGPNGLGWWPTRVDPTQIKPTSYFWRAC